jgi:hypothetical protein
MSIKGMDDAQERAARARRLADFKEKVDKLARRLVRFVRSASSAPSPSPKRRSAAGSGGRPRHG